tara:strand:+ start:918 stop:1223 length:306 start_codon:yes stop_codon:yes gene_type:complete
MRKFSVIFLILSLILFTAIIKNSTKRIDDEIFVIEEKIRDLKKDLENIKLEYEYLSSAEKLLNFQKIYFDNELIKKDIQGIKIIEKGPDQLIINQLKLNND